MTYNLKVYKYILNVTLLYFLILLMLDKTIASNAKFHNIFLKLNASSYANSSLEDFYENKFIRNIYISLLDINIGYKFIDTYSASVNNMQYSTYIYGSVGYNMQAYTNYLNRDINFEIDENNKKTIIKNSIQDKEHGKTHFGLYLGFSINHSILNDAFIDIGLKGEFSRGELMNNHFNKRKQIKEIAYSSDSNLKDKEPNFNELGPLELLSSGRPLTNEQNISNSSYAGILIGPEIKIGGSIYSTESIKLQLGANANFLMSIKSYQTTAEEKNASTNKYYIYPYAVLDKESRVSKIKYDLTQDNQNTSLNAIGINNEDISKYIEQNDEYLYNNIFNNKRISIGIYLSLHVNMDKI